MFSSRNITNRQKILVCLCVLPFLAKILLSQLFFVLTEKRNDDLFSYALCVVFDFVALILPFAIYGCFSKNIPHDAKNKKLTEIILVFFSAYFIANFLSILYTFFLSVCGFSFSSSKGLQFDNAKALVFIANSVVLAPIAEEFAFRKILLKNLLPLSRIPAIIISTAFFACFHDVASFVYSFVFGIALAYVCLEYGFIYSVLLHAVNNCLTYFYIFLEQSVGEKTYFVFLIVRLSLTALLGMYSVVKLLKKRCCGGKNS